MEKEEETYEAEVWCGNCGAMVTAEIPKGVSTREFPHTAECPNCGCEMCGCH